jgi:hypothetical protein
MVKVPRAVAESYYYKPWSDVVAAAEDRVDGLIVASPAHTPWRPLPPKRESYLPDRQADFDRDLATWEGDQGVCFLYEGDRQWPKNKTLLFQQNW